MLVCGEGGNLFGKTPHVGLRLITSRHVLVPGSDLVVNL